MDNSHHISNAPRNVGPTPLSNELLRPDHPSIKRVTRRGSALNGLQFFLLFLRESPNSILSLVGGRLYLTDNCSSIGVYVVRVPADEAPESRPLRSVDWSDARASPARREFLRHWEIFTSHPTGAAETIQFGEHVSEIYLTRARFVAPWHICDLDVPGITKARTASFRSNRLRRVEDGRGRP